MHVRRQVKLFSNSRLAFGPPKNGRPRIVPMSTALGHVIAAHRERHPSADVSLPWRKLDGKGTTVPLLLTNSRQKALRRGYFNASIWKKAVEKAGLEPSRENGCHALRHHYASVLLDAGGNIRALSDYLGHSDPGFTLRTYTHLMPASNDRARQVIDEAFKRYAFA